MTDNQEAVLSAATGAITELASKYRVDLLALMHPGGDRELGIKECAKIVAKHFSGFQPILEIKGPIKTKVGASHALVEMCCGTPIREGRCSVCGDKL